MVGSGLCGRTSSPDVRLSRGRATVVRSPAPKARRRAAVSSRTSPSWTMVDRRAVVESLGGAAARGKQVHQGGLDCGKVRSILREVEFEVNGGFKVLLGAADGEVVGANECVSITRALE